MAAFASDRRSGWVRFLVVLLCALFLFSTLCAPAARAEALTVGLFTAAAVLSAATAALGFKLSNSAEGQATLAKMVQDFKTVAWATGFVLVGSKINGLIDGVDYIKMQVKAGKTYLDERVVAWVQQWLARNGVYSEDSVTWPDYEAGTYLVIKQGNMTYQQVSSYFSAGAQKVFSNLISGYDLDLSHKVYQLSDEWSRYGEVFCIYVLADSMIGKEAQIVSSVKPHLEYISHSGFHYDGEVYEWRSYWEEGHFQVTKYSGMDPFYLKLTNVESSYGLETYCSNIADVVVTRNDTGLSGTDTIGQDVLDKTLDETLAGLKEWAPDWWDAGADSSTNAATGAKDLPLNMGSDVKTVTGNPALEVDQPLIYTPWFDETLENLRNGETAGTVTNTATSAADTADKADAAQATVEDAQGVVQSLISWGLDYISPDKGLFSRFPLCIPYDAYLLVTAALGVDAQDLGEIVGQSPGELSPQVDDGVAVQSDFVPVISVKHDWTQDGVTTPVEVTIDLRPYDAVIKMIRMLVSVYVIAELIASEYKRIRGS